MPPPSDRWATSGPGPGSDRPDAAGAGSSRSALVTALVLTGVVATAVVLATRTTADRRRRPPSRRRPVGQRPRRTGPGQRPAPSPTADADADPAGPRRRRPTSPTAAPADPLPTASRRRARRPGPDRSLRTNTLYGVDLDRASVDCGLKVRRPKPPLANKKLQPYLDRGRRLPDDGVQGAARRARLHAGGADGEDVPQPGREPLRRLRPERLAGVLLLHHPHHLLARHRRRRARGVHVRAARLRRPDRPRVRAPPAGDDRHALRATPRRTTRRPRRSATPSAAASSSRRSASRACSCTRRPKTSTCTRKDRTELEAWHSYTGDEDPPKDRKPDHGSSKAQWGWLERGLDSGDFADCNTWTAKAKSVT